MKENFEDKFMEVQSDLISLCLELTDSQVDKVYAYASIEKNSTMFNAFFERNGEILTLKQLNVESRTAMDFLRIGTGDLERIREVCQQYETQTPTEIKMFYDVKTRKFNADYQYGEVCSLKTGKSSGEVFMQWCNEMKEKNKKHKRFFWQRQ